MLVSFGPITELSYLLSVLAMLNTAEVINVINMASPGDPSLTSLWQQAQAINSDLVNVSNNKKLNYTPPCTDCDIG
jgi:hypothetical protein